MEEKKYLLAEVKILMISMFSPHFFNWAEQLKDSGHEIFWLDVFDSKTEVPKIDFAHQIINWRYKWDFPGRYFLKERAPLITRLINKINERELVNFVDDKIKEIEPDVIHSFVMYIGAAPILDVMIKYPKIKWIYSSWGSDLFYYRNKANPLFAMQKTLPYVDFMFSDCKRDLHIAKANGFSGCHLGVFPGGGGYDFAVSDPLIKPISEKNLILIKGYQGLHGKCIEVIEALLLMKVELQKYNLVIYGAGKEVIKYINKSEIANWKNFTYKENIKRDEVMKLMGKALLSVGNSTSDGIPNTLLEAMIMGAFPIQSNPGGASSELIRDGFNGLLIEDPTNITEIANILCRAVSGDIDLKKGIQYNFSDIKPQLERNRIRKTVLKKYQLVEIKIEVEQSFCK